MMVPLRPQAQASLIKLKLQYIHTYEISLSREQEQRIEEGRRRVGGVRCEGRDCEEQLKKHGGKWVETATKSADGT